MTASMMGFAMADEVPGGPATVIGSVFKSNGNPATTADADPATIGITLVILDQHGLEQGKYTDKLAADAEGNLIYSITIQQADYRSGWTYYLEVDGTEWGDVDYKAEDNQASGVFEWSLSEGTIPHDIRTLSEIPQNFKPIIAIVFIIILFLLGILFIGILNRQKTDVMILSKTKTTDKKGNVAWEYVCVYGDPEDPTEIGEVVSNMDYQPNSFVTVSSNKIARTFDGEYVWYKPKLVDMSKVPDQMRPLAPITKKSMEKKWFAGGCIGTVEGQSVSSAVRRYKTFVFSTLVMPFILAEIIIGALSVEVSALAIPPWLGAGFIINILLLLVAIILLIVYMLRTIGKEKKKVQPTKAEDLYVLSPKMEEGEPLVEESAKPEEGVPQEPPVDETPETLETEEIPETAKPPEPGPQFMSCPNCGKPVASDYMICPHCSTKLK
jgi:hypothetical protein